MEQTMKAAEEELLNTELARRFRGGVIMDVVNPEQARIAEEERHRVAYTSSDPPCVWLAVFGAGSPETAGIDLLEEEMS